MFPMNKFRSTNANQNTNKAHTQTYANTRTHSQRWSVDWAHTHSRNWFTHTKSLPEETCVTKITLLLHCTHRSTKNHQNHNNAPHITQPRRSATSTADRTPSSTQAAATTAHRHHGTNNARIIFFVYFGGASENESNPKQTKLNFTKNVNTLLTDYLKKVRYTKYAELITHLNKQLVKLNMQNATAVCCGRSRPMERDTRTQARALISNLQWNVLLTMKTHSRFFRERHTCSFENASSLP